VRNSNRRGAEFEAEVVDAMVRAGWLLLGRHVKADYGLEVDIVARAPWSDSPWWIECKGGTIPGRSGLARCDTVKKAIGTAWALRSASALHHGGRYLLVSSMMPKPGTVAMALLADALRERLIHGAVTIEGLLALGPGDTD